MQQTDQGYLIDIKPDWGKSPMRLTLDFSTYQMRSYNGGEQRTCWREFPRLPISYQLPFRMTGAIRMAFNDALTGPVLVPLWCCPLFITAASNTPSVPNSFAATHSSQYYGEPHYYTLGIFKPGQQVYAEAAVGTGLYSLLDTNPSGYIQLDGSPSLPFTLYPVLRGQLKDGKWGWAASSLQTNDTAISVEEM